MVIRWKIPLSDEEGDYKEDCFVSVAVTATTDTNPYAGRRGPSTVHIYRPIVEDWEIEKVVNWEGTEIPLTPTLEDEINNSNGFHAQVSYAYYKQLQEED